MENTKLCVLRVLKSVWMKICQNTNTRNTNMNNSQTVEQDSSNVQEDNRSVTQNVQIFTKVLLTKPEYVI